MSASCRKCQAEIELTRARKRSYNYICTRCANRQRDSDDARYMARKLADSLRRKGVAKPYPGVKFVRRVISKCQGKSVLSGASDTRRLCVLLLNNMAVLNDTALPNDMALLNDIAPLSKPSAESSACMRDGFSVENAVLVTLRERIALEHKAKGASLHSPVKL